jgi:hypothetical protein
MDPSRTITAFGLLLGAGGTAAGVATDAAVACSGSDGVRATQTLSPTMFTQELDGW